MHPGWQKLFFLGDKHYNMFISGLRVAQLGLEPVCEVFPYTYAGNIMIFSLKRKLHLFFPIGPTLSFKKCLSHVRQGASPGSQKNVSEKVGVATYDR